MRSLLTSLLFWLIAPILVAAQFGNIFEHLFQGGQQQQHQQQADVASDSAWYQSTYNGATCSLYLCPGTLSCVSQPTHCPCAFEAFEDKFELSDGSAVCISKMAKKSGAAKKIELARKGLL